MERPAIDRPRFRRGMSSAELKAKREVLALELEKKDQLLRNSITKQQASFRGYVHRRTDREDAMGLLDTASHLERQGLLRGEAPLAEKIPQIASYLAQQEPERIPLGPPHVRAAALRQRDQRILEATDAKMRELTEQLTPTVVIDEYRKYATQNLQRSRERLATAHLFPAKMEQLQAQLQAQDALVKEKTSAYEQTDPNDLVLRGSIEKEMRAASSRLKYMEAQMRGIEKEHQLARRAQFFQQALTRFPEVSRELEAKHELLLLPARILEEEKMTRATAILAQLQRQEEALSPPPPSEHPSASPSSPKGVPVSSSPTLSRSASSLGLGLVQGGPSSALPATLLSHAREQSHSPSPSPQPLSSASPLKPPTADLSLVGGSGRVATSSSVATVSPSGGSFLRPGLAQQLSSIPPSDFPFPASSPTAPHGPSPLGKGLPPFGSDPFAVSISPTPQALPQRRRSSSSASTASGSGSHRGSVSSVGEAEGTSPQKRRPLSSTPAVTPYQQHARRPSLDLSGKPSPKGQGDEVLHESALSASDGQRVSLTPPPPPPPSPLRPHAQSQAVVSLTTAATPGNASSTASPSPLVDPLASATLGASLPSDGQHESPLPPPPLSPPHSPRRAPSPHPDPSAQQQQRDTTSPRVPTPHSGNTPPNPTDGDQAL